MDLDFSDEQQMLREMARGVCADFAPLDVVRELEDDPVGYPEGFWKQLAALDLIGLTIPAAYGGSEMTSLEAAILYEELGRSLAPSPHFASAVVSAGVLVAAGSEEQKQRWLPAIAAGDAILTPAWIEPASRLRLRGRAGHGPGRRRRRGARRHQVARAVRLVGDAARRAGAGRRRGRAVPGRPERGWRLARRSR